MVLQHLVERPSTVCIGRRVVSYPDCHRRCDDPVAEPLARLLARLLDAQPARARGKRPLPLPHEHLGEAKHCLQQRIPQHGQSRVDPYHALLDALHRESHAHVRLSTPALRMSDRPQPLVAVHLEKFGRLDPIPSQALIRSRAREFLRDSEAIHRHPFRRVLRLQVDDIPDHIAQVTVLAGRRDKDALSRHLG